MIDPYPYLPHTVKKYELQSVLGKGGFAYVYKAVHAFYKMEFAVKVISPPEEDNERILRSFDAEVNALIKLDHPNVIRLYDHFMEDGRLFLVLEFCSGGNLETMISRGDLLPEPAKLKICSQIISALKYCYDQSISHRDIKASNILFNANGRVKVADFGLSQLIGHDENFNEFNGSLSYASPEIVRQIAHNPFKSDVWSLGVLFYRLFTYSYPFNGRSKSELKDRIVNGIYTEKIQGQIGRIIRKMLNVDPDMRISIEQLHKNELFMFSLVKLPTLSISKQGCQPAKSYRVILAQPNKIQAISSRRSSLTYSLKEFQSKVGQATVQKKNNNSNAASHATFTAALPSNM